LEFWVLGDSLLAQVGHLQYCSIWYQCQFSSLFYTNLSW
jgi:hypothetical protein